VALVNLILFYLLTIRLLLFALTGAVSDLTRLVDALIALALVQELSLRTEVCGLMV
jgi:hypothetical protein